MRRWRAGAALGGAVALAVAMSFGRFAYTPVLPFMRDADGLSTPAAGWIASANYLGYLLGAASADPVARRAGLRPTVRAGLAVSVVTTAAMAATSTPLVWAALRLVGGVASAWAMIAVTSLVMAGAEDRRRTSDVMFAGVGAGIVVSTLVIALCAAGSDRPRPMWIALGLTAPPVRSSPTASSARRRYAAAQPRPARTPAAAAEVRRLIVAYACAGFGYVITATYLVLIVRDSDLGQVARVPDVVRRRCVRCLLTVAVEPGRRPHRRPVGAGGRPRRARPRRPDHGVRPRNRRRRWSGGALFGATFVGIVGVGVDLARRLHPSTRPGRSP